MTRVERGAIGALMGAAACFIASTLIIDGVTPQRTIACVAAALAGIVIYTRLPRIAWALFIASVAAWCIVAFSPLARTMSNGLVRRDPLPRSIDAVVVLSGSVSRDGMLGREALDRLLSGLALIRDGRSSTIVVTESRPWRDHSITTTTDQRNLISLLAAAPRVVVIPNVVSTRTEALGTARRLPPATARTIAVVTSPLHTRRACLVFEHVGYEVTCVPSESRDIALHSLVTVSDRLAAFRMALYERAAMALYSHRGWV